MIYFRLVYIAGFISGLLILNNAESIQALNIALLLSVPSLTIMAFDIWSSVVINYRQAKKNRDIIRL